MQRISMDTIGHLEIDGNINAYMLVILDRLKRWVELCATTSTAAIEMSEHLLDWFGRFGFADEVMTDSGTQFTSEL